MTDYQSSHSQPLLELKGDPTQEEGRDSSIQAVNSLSATDCTNIIAGLKMGVEVLEQRRHKNPVSSIILLSDGHDNQNNDFDHELSLLPPCIRSNEADDAMIPVHAFGFGSDHDATALHAIADGSQGTGYGREGTTRRSSIITASDTKWCIGELKCGGNGWM